MFKQLRSPVTSLSAAEVGRCCGALATLDLWRRSELLGTWETVWGRQDNPAEEDLGETADLGVPGRGSIKENSMAGFH